jgi:Flavin-binding monooxygenase-like
MPQPQEDGVTVNGPKSSDEVNDHVPFSEEGGTYGIPNGEKSNSIPPARNSYMDEITIPLNEVPAFTPTKKLRVVIIGAGYSGLIMAHKLMYEHVQTTERIVDFTIFEAKHVTGGTWVDNTYPGVMCDVPSAIYAFPFDPNPNWSHFYSEGKEILEYMQNTVKKWKLDKHIQFNTKVTGCYWCEDISQWRIAVSRRNGPDEEWHGADDEYTDVLVSARGFLSTWHWPKIPGLHSFKGQKVHSAGWDHSYDYRHKRIGIIGNGSSGIQILPQMAKLPGTTVTSFQRGPTWVFSRHTPAQLVGSDDPSFNPEYRDCDKERFRDPEEMKKYRKVVQGGINKAFRMFVKGSEANRNSTDFAVKQMSAKLNCDPVLCEKLIPKWELGCRYVCSHFSCLCITISDEDKGD